ncbi:hypothetical protein [Aureivirga marina]|uniref:hypothetical protein n=1 Tax=Aureivirga marina TaxID=1182451 RepID=UPI0018CB1525|nr:hypothetical protein [Aureivirga marina]
MEEENYITTNGNNNNILNNIQNSTIIIKYNESQSKKNEKRNYIEQNDINPKAVLFNNYSPRNKEYYVERNIDNIFKNALNLNNLWIFGKSGVGKTAMIHRNLLNSNIKYCYCDLSPVDIYDSDIVLNEILSAIEDEFNLERNYNQKNVIKQISNLLCNLNSSKIIIAIDELSISNEEIYRKIANDLFNLVNYYNNQSEDDELTFIVSTIIDPLKLILNKSKASSFFQYICCNPWEDNIEDLYILISKHLQLNLDDSKKEIISACKNSPRILKNIFKNILLQNDNKKESISIAIQKTLNEIV